MQWFSLSDHVEKIILFGSYATQNETDSSDIDICLIVQQKSIQLDKQLSDIEEQFYDDYLCHLSPYVLTAKDYDDESFPIVSEIKKEGKELWSKLNQ